MGITAAIRGQPTQSGRLAAKWSELRFADLPNKAIAVAKADLLDMAGLCIAARQQDYVRQMTQAWDSEGPCTVIGHERALDAAGAAVVNGMATHGEDFDDTLEGAPIRVGAMVIPSVLACAERFGLSGERALLGIVAGLETICRLNHVAPGAMHKACFHPVGVIGALGGAAGCAVALDLPAQQVAMALGVAASFSSGIIEFLTDGAWTKRLHPGWAAQSGFKAALIARAGFFAPQTVLDGAHNFFRAFAPSAVPDYRHLTDGLGDEWYMERIAFKPYACGTMIHPYIDCMIRLSKLVAAPEDIDTIVCETGEGLVHRLWEPLADKHAPPSGYAAKFSMPFCMAVAFFDGDAGLQQFTNEKARDPRVLELARKITYVIDDANEYPKNYTGHIRVVMRSGQVHELRQSHMRGGVREPLTQAEIVKKFQANCGYGGIDAATADRLLHFCETVDRAADLSGLAAFRIA